MAGYHSSKCTNPTRTTAANSCTLPAAFMHGGQHSKASLDVGPPRRMKRRSEGLADLFSERPYDSSWLVHTLKPNKSHLLFWLKIRLILTQQPNFCERKCKYYLVKDKLRKHIRTNFAASRSPSAYWNLTSIEMLLLGCRAEIAGFNFQIKGLSSSFNLMFNT